MPEAGQHLAEIII